MEQLNGNLKETNLGGSQVKNLQNCECMRIQQHRINLISFYLLDANFLRDIRLHDMTLYGDTLIHGKKYTKKTHFSTFNVISF